MAPMARSKRVTASQKRARRDESEQEDGTSSGDDDFKALDSDNLDDEKVEATNRGRKEGAKRKKVGDTPTTKGKKRRKKVESDEDESDGGLKDGQEVVGKVVRAPKTGQGEAGSVNPERE